MINYQEGMEIVKMMKDSGQVKKEGKHLKSRGKDEMWCEWFECDECGNKNVMPGSNFCSNCGVDIRAKMPV